MLAELCSLWHKILLILLILLLFFVWYVSLVVSKEEEIIVVAVSWLLKSSVNLNKSVAEKNMPWTLIIQRWIKNVDRAFMQRGKWCARMALPVNKADSLTKVFSPHFDQIDYSIFASNLSKCRICFPSLFIPTFTQSPPFFHSGLLPEMK